MTVLADLASETKGRPTPAGPTRPAAKVPRPVLIKQRQRRRRFLIGFTLFTAVCVFLTGTAYVYIQYRVGQIERVRVPGLVEDGEGQVMNVLLVGSDSRDRLEGAAAAQAGKGQVSGGRSDTIMILHIDPRQQQAGILSVPRDLWVPIAGAEFSDKINASFALGGAPQLIATIQQSLGISINHYVQVDFVGFQDIVDTVGGVDLYTPTPARDFTSGLDIPRGGCVRLDGAQGLAFVRSRNYEILIGGTWQTDPRGDLGRIKRQQEFIRRMMKKALSSGITNPVQLNRLIGIGVKDVKIDDALSSKDITTLARRFSNVNPDSVALLTLPTAPADIPGVSAEKLLVAESQPILDRINGKAPLTTPEGVAPVPTTPTTVGPASVGVRVLNGMGTAGVAAKAATALQGAGFTVAGPPGDADSRAQRTTVRYAPAQLAKAQLLERHLQAGAVLTEDATLSGTDVVLVLGSDYAGLRASPAPAPSTPAPTTTVDAGLTPAPLPQGTAAPPPC